MSATTIAMFTEIGPPTEEPPHPPPMGGVASGVTLGVPPRQR